MVPHRPLSSSFLWFISRSYKVIPKRNYLGAYGSDFQGCCSWIRVPVVGSYKRFKQSLEVSYPGSSFIELCGVLGFTAVGFSVPLQGLWVLYLKVTGCRS